MSIAPAIAKYSTCNIREYSTVRATRITIALFLIKHLKAMTNSGFVLPVLVQSTELIWGYILPYMHIFTVKDTSLSLIP